MNSDSLFLFGQIAAWPEGVKLIRMQEDVRGMISHNDNAAVQVYIDKTIIKWLLRESCHKYFGHRSLGMASTNG